MLAVDIDTYTLEQRNLLIEEYQGFVKKIVRYLLSSLSLPFKYESELESAGYLGLVEAADRFDPGAGTPFPQFAKMRIRGAIIDSIRKHSHLSGKAYRMSKALEAMSHLRDCMEIETIEEVLEFAAQGALTFELSMSEVGQEINEIADDAPSPFDLLETTERYKVLRSVVKGLPARERSIVELYYFQGKSFVDIAKEDESLSKSWVSRLHARALELIRERLSETEYVS